MEKYAGPGLDSIQRAGSCLYTSKKKIIKKESKLTQMELQAVASITDHMISKGFRDIAVLKKDINGKPYFVENGRLYAAYDDYEGKKLKIRTTEAGIAFAGFAACFHSFAEGYVQPPGIKARVMWGKKVEEYRKDTLRFEKGFRNLRDDGAHNEFEAYILKNGDEILNRAHASMKVLKSGSYLKTLESSMRKKEVCINRISDNSAVVCNDRIILKKFFDIGFNMVEEDIALIIKKAAVNMKSTDACDPIIESYDKTRSLDNGSAAVIKALAAFPEDTVKIAVKYFKDRYMDELLVNKLKKYWSRELYTDFLEVVHYGMQIQG